MNYLACGTVAVWDSHHCNVQQSISTNAGQPLCFSSAKAVLHPVDTGTSYVPLMWCDPLLPHFLLQVNLEKSAVGGWSCRESVSFQWLSKPWRWATQRNREEISWEKQASWGNLTTPTSSTWKVSSQKVGTTCSGLLPMNSGCWESWLREKDLSDACSEYTFSSFLKKNFSFPEAGKKNRTVGEDVKNVQNHN